MKELRAFFVAAAMLAVVAPAWASGWPAAPSQPTTDLLHLAQGASCEARCAVECDRKRAFCARMLRGFPLCRGPQCEGNCVRECHAVASGRCQRVYDCRTTSKLENKSVYGCRYEYNYFNSGKYENVCKNRNEWVWNHHHRECNWVLRCR